MVVGNCPQRAVCDAFSSGDSEGITGCRTPSERDADAAEVPASFCSSIGDVAGPRFSVAGAGDVSLSGSDNPSGALARGCDCSLLSPTVTGTSDSILIGALLLRSTSRPISAARTATPASGTHRHTGRGKNAGAGILTGVGYGSSTMRRATRGAKFAQYASPGSGVCSVANTRSSFSASSTCRCISVDSDASWRTSSGNGSAP